MYQTDLYIDKKIPRILQKLWILNSRGFSLFENSKRYQCLFALFYRNTNRLIKILQFPIKFHTIFKSFSFNTSMRLFVWICSQTITSLFSIQFG